MKRRRRNAISGQFSARLIDMLESPAYRALSLGAHRVLARIEIELAHHGGNDNGSLPVTYDDFQRYGIHRHAIAPAIRELVALGFILVELGCSGNAEFRAPNRFGLTYRPREGVDGDGSHEWRRIKTTEEADQIAATARQTPLENSRRRGGKRVSRSPGHSSKNKCPVPDCAEADDDFRHWNPVRFSPLQGPVTVFATTSISRVGAGGLPTNATGPNPVTLGAADGDLALVTAEGCA